MPITLEKNTATLNPNLGIYLDRPGISLDKRMLADCRNIRIRGGRIIRSNAGYTKFITRNLVDPVVMIDSFFDTGGSQFLLIATTKNLYKYDSGADDVNYLNPAYITGTVAVTNGSAIVTGTGTSWLANLKAGDFFNAGSNARVDPDATWYEIQSVDSDTQITLTVVYAEATQSGINYTGRKTFTGNVKAFWSTDVFYNAQPSGDDHWYGTNGSDSIIRWNMSDTFATEVLTFTCRLLRVFNDMLICGDITESAVNKPINIKNSDITKPEDFVNGVAGEFTTQDDIGPIKEMLRLGDSLVLYSERNIILQQFIGGDLTFAFREVITGIGPIGTRAIMDFGDFHEFLGQDSQYRFDGISVSKINQHVWKEILKIHAPDRNEFIQAHIDEENGEVYWVMPLNSDPGDATLGQPTTAYSQHYLEDVGEHNPDPFTIRDLVATAMGYFSRQTTLRFSDLSDPVENLWQVTNFRWNDRFFSANFPFSLFGDEDGNVFILGESDSADGSDINSFADFGIRSGIDGFSKTIIKRIHPFCERIAGASHDLNIILRGTDHADGNLTDLSNLPYDLDHGVSNNRFVSPMQSARFYQVGIQVSGQGVGFSFAGYDVEKKRAGKR